MQPVAVFFFEPGMPACVPGVTKGTPAMFFPFWSNHTLLDFHLVNFSDKNKYKLFFILQESQKKLLLKLSVYLKKESAEIIVLDDGIFSFIETLNTLQTDTCLFISLSFIALFQTPQQSRQDIENAFDIIKISADSVPLDIYWGKRKKIINYLHSNLSQYSEKMGIMEFFFTNILQNYFDEIIEIPGKVYFHNHIQQLYRNNLWLIQNQLSTEVRQFTSACTGINRPHPNSYIGSSGIVKNSLIGSGVEVFGYVENSIIFSDVVVGENSKIIDSVIMTNNRIGKNCTINNAIIFPYFDEIQNNDYNISDNVLIGNKNSGMKNETFPNQINNGLCVVGMNNSLPRDFVIEPGSYLEADVQEKELRKIEKIKKGATFYRKIEN